jgi:hypothetical protein
MPTAFKHKYLIKATSRAAIVTTGIMARVWMLVSASREADAAQQILEIERRTAVDQRPGAAGV